MNKKLRIAFTGESKLNIDSIFRTIRSFGYDLIHGYIDSEAGMAECPEGISWDLLISLNEGPDVVAEGLSFKAQELVEANVPC